VVPKYIVFEFIQNWGVMRNESWDRYFMNEKDNQWYQEAERKVTRDRKTFPYNLTTSSGKSNF